jgi:hypothetical protein
MAAYLTPQQHLITHLRCVMFTLQARLQLAQYAGTRVNSSASSVLHGPASTSGGLNHHQQHQGSLQDDVLELSHRVVRGFVARLTRAPLYITFRLWAALAR